MLRFTTTMVTPAMPMFFCAPAEQTPHTTEDPSAAAATAAAAAVNECKGGYLNAVHQQKHQR